MRELNRGHIWEINVYICTQTEDVSTVSRDLNLAGIKRNIESKCLTKLIVDSVLTYTISSISSVAFSAGAAVRTRLVNTAGMSVTEITSFATLIHVITPKSISFESWATSTVIGANGVFADRMSIAVVCSRFTLIDVIARQSISCESWATLTVI